MSLTRFRSGGKRWKNGSPSLFQATRSCLINWTIFLAEKTLSKVATVGLRCGQILGEERTRRVPLIWRRWPGVGFKAQMSIGLPFTERHFRDEWRYPLTHSRASVAGFAPMLPRQLLTGPALRSCILFFTTIHRIWPAFAIRLGCRRTPSI